MSKKILVVDDSSIYIDTVTARLNEEGYDDINSALSGEEGFNKTKDLKPNLIICDVVLPDIKGFDLCRQIKNFKELTAKIILITGEIDAIDTREARLAGADSFLVKTSNDSLIETVKEFLN